MCVYLFRGVGCHAFRECLKSANCHLQLLNLSWNPISSEGGLMLSEALPVREFESELFEIDNHSLFFVFMPEQRLVDHSPARQL